ncbi:hypothetical protein [Vibrio agarivorans]|uniref:Uncharacterized protein n=1 Tax=Vibrio agarivorans TaxID=153622 RepID=A0ABT7Y0I0_9VIBR|nr:hypothetical protein [Vibrio agarivorans]MDN2481548.1 hypothetical protein [Vibrio agarivorans]
MIATLLMTFPPMLLGAQLVLTLILVKGEICPGQRGRIHRVLPVLAILWLAVCSLRVEAFMVVFAIFYFYTQVQTKKTREQGPLWLLYLAGGLAATFTLMLSLQAPQAAMTLGMITWLVLLGGALAHGLLVVARTRLQAFHRLLPFSGVIAAMLFALCVLWLSYALDIDAHPQLLMPIVSVVVMLIIGVVAWCWHLIRQSEPNKYVIFFALILLLGSSQAFLSLSSLAAPL